MLDLCLSENAKIKLFFNLAEQNAFVVTRIRRNPLKC